MATIPTLINWRQESDGTIRVRLRDSGVAADWSGFEEIRAYMYSNAQRVIAGKCSVTVDGTDPTILVCVYPATEPQYLGVNSIIIRCKYHGRNKTYDKPVANIVARTADVAGDVVLDDPEVDVQIEVEDVSTSILDEAISSAFDAAARASEAAAEAQAMIDIKQGPPGKSAYQIAVDNGYEGTEEEWLESLAPAAVQYVGQELTPGQQQQARSNIDAAPRTAVAYLGEEVGTV